MILPFYGSGNATVLFVGTRFYTRRYPAVFREGALTTLDADPRMSRHGARRHVVARIQDVARHVEPASFDVVILNGVLGWGVNDIPAADETIDAIRAVLRPGGELVLGVNELIPTSPPLSELRALDAFEPLEFPPLGTATWTVQTPFAEREHTFTFWRAR